MQQDRRLSNSLTRTASLVSGALITLLTLSGCVHESIFEKPKIQVKSSSAFSQQRQLMLQQHPELTEAALPQHWWQLFNDPTLSALEQQLANNNLDVQIALLRIQESQAALGQAEAAQQPQLNFDANYSRSAISENIPLAKLGAKHRGYNLWTMGLQASWELDLWGYLKHLNQAAEANVQAKIYNQQQIKVSLAAELAKNYLLLRGAQTQLAILQNMQQLDQQLVHVYQNKQKNGVATNADIAQIETLATQTRQQVELQQQQVALLKNSVALLLGQAPKQLDEFLGQQILPINPRQIPIGLSSDFVKNRPDILQADAELRAALEHVHAAKADFYPRVGLSAQLGEQAFSLSEFDSWGSRQYGIGPTLHLPIFDGGRLKSTLALNESREKIAAVQYQQTVLKAWHEVDNALIDYQHVQTETQLLQQQLKENQTTEHVALRNFQQGSYDRAQVILPQKQRLNTQLVIVQNRTASALAIVALYRALGGEGAQQWSAHMLQEKP